MGKRVSGSLRLACRRLSHDFDGILSNREIGELLQAHGEIKTRAILEEIRERGDDELRGIARLASLRPPDGKEDG